ncbi:hypothetical protein MUP77_01945 [Candidatus Bathyarchaeota archaeon]|nr:hypothetical protein [Candidatus Bathyarchaeota archaeon]
MSGESQRLFSSIENRVSTRFEEGSQQAKLLFFDMTNEMNFSLGIRLSDVFGNIVEPKEHRLIFYVSVFFGHNSSYSLKYPDGHIVDLEKKYFQSYINSKDSVLIFNHHSGTHYPQILIKKYFQMS